MNQDHNNIQSSLSGFSPFRVYYQLLREPNYLLDVFRDSGADMDFIMDVYSLEKKKLHQRSQIEKEEHIRNLNRVTDIFQSILKNLTLKVKEEIGVFVDEQNNNDLSSVFVAEIEYLQRAFETNKCLFSIGKLCMSEMRDLRLFVVADVICKLRRPKLF